ncbi:MAG: cytochrome c [Pseudomonadota bacterium]
MKRLLLPLLCMLALPTAAEDMRQLAPLPVPAQQSLREEMLDNLVALHEILSLVGDGKYAEAGEVAEGRLGWSARGVHAGKPPEARPGLHMPPAMHAMGMDGHKAASEFAVAAKTGDREKTLAALPKLMTACVSCHAAYRAR